MATSLGKNIYVPLKIYLYLGSRIYQRSTKGEI